MELIRKRKRTKWKNGPRRPNGGLARLPRNRDTGTGETIIQKKASGSVVQVCNPSSSGG